MAKRDSHFRDSWLERVTAAPDLSDAVRVLLMVLARKMTAAGYVSIPRHDLAKQIGRSPRRVTDRIQSAILANYLAVVRSGCPGHTAEYQAMVPAGGDGARARTKRLGSTGAADRTNPSGRSAANISGLSSAPPWLRRDGADGGPTNARASEDQNRASLRHNSAGGVAQSPSVRELLSDEQQANYAPRDAVRLPLRRDPDCYSCQVESVMPSQLCPNHSTRNSGIRSEVRSR